MDGNKLGGNEQQPTLEQSLWNHSLQSALHQAELDLIAALLILANLAEDDGDLTLALTCYDRIIGLDACHALAILGRGAILMQHKKWAESVAAFEAAALLDPEDALPHIYLGQTLGASGQTEAAAAAWAAAAQRDAIMTQISQDLIKVSAHFRETGCQGNIAVWNQLIDKVDAHTPSK